MTRLPLLLSLLAAGCLYRAPTIPLQADAGSREMLAGKWNGTFTVDGPDRRGGTIFFALVAGATDAEGSVLMIPTPARDDDRRGGVQPPFNTPPDPRPTEVLTIRSMHVVDGDVSGITDPHWEADVDMNVSTSFRGTLTAWTMQGTFRATYADGTMKSTGTWKVTRQDP
jgi:hypothetical protein